MVVAEEVSMVDEIVVGRDVVDKIVVGGDVVKSTQTEQRHCEIYLPYP